MRSIVSCQKIRVPNHTWVQLSAGVLNVRLDSDSTYPVITNLMQLNRIMGSVLCDIAVLVS